MTAGASSDKDGGDGEKDLHRDFDDQAASVGSPDWLTCSNPSPPP
jgi:hypothetical protein